jgi:UDP-2,4-diacetamido-2,4,6-trideoxy-beta-L-altropyranose hydrolase
MTSAGRLIIRADANVAIGTGHVMRCIALAQAWQEQGGSATFLSADMPAVLEERLRSEGFEVKRLQAHAGSDEDAKQTAACASEIEAVWVIADSYAFGEEYQRKLKEAALKVLLFDDNGHAGRYLADIVLNQNIHAVESLYHNRSAHTRLLLGTAFTLLRREFRAGQGRGREVPARARKILVTLGGSDPENLTRRVLEALSLAKIEGMQAKIVLGGGNPHRDAIEQAAALLTPRPEVLSDVRNMHELMTDADLAITGAGSTAWELCFMGVPSLLVVLADNQVEIARGLDRLGACVNLGDGARLDVNSLADSIRAVAESSQEREQMSLRARQIVDGKGVYRVLDALYREGGTNPLKAISMLRPGNA